MIVIFSDQWEKEAQPLLQLRRHRVCDVFTKKAYTTVRLEQRRHPIRVCSYGPNSCGLHSYGPYSHGLHSYDNIRFGHMPCVYNRSYAHVCTHVYMSVCINVHTRADTLSVRKSTQMSIIDVYTHVTLLHGPRHLESHPVCNHCRLYHKSAGTAVVSPRYMALPASTFSHARMFVCMSIHMCMCMPLRRSAHMSIRTLMQMSARMSTHSSNQKARLNK